METDIDIYDCHGHVIALCTRKAAGPGTKRFKQILYFWLKALCADFGLLGEGSCEAVGSHCRPKVRGSLWIPVLLALRLRPKLLKALPAQKHSRLLL